MRLLLINPPFDLIRHGYGSQSTVRRGYLPPLGLGALATYLCRHGHHAVVYDAAASGADIAETLRAAGTFLPDAVGITATTLTMPAAGEAAAAVRQQSDVPIIIGGPHAALAPESILHEHPAVTMVISGPGQIPARLLLDRQLHPDGIPNCFWRSADGSIHSGPRATFSFADYPYPDRTLFDLSMYQPLPNQSRRTPVTSAITSTGCPHARCGFCFEAGPAGAPYQRRPVADVLAELAELCGRHGIREVAFWDDIFTAGADWLIDFCRRLKAQRLPLIWTCYGSVTTVTPSLLAAMRTAGCYNIYYGMESGNDDILAGIGKGFTTADIRRACAETRAADIAIRGAFIYGFPDETYAQNRRTLALALELPLDSCQFRPYCPEPGTVLHARARVTGTFISEYMRHGIHDVVYVPAGYSSAQQLHDLVQRSYRAFYLRPSYMLQQLAGVRSGRDLLRLTDGFRFFTGLLRAGRA